MITQKTTPKLQTDPLLVEEAIHLIKAVFETELTSRLGLKRVSAPAVVLKGTGINDDLSGIERPVGFPIKAMQEQRAEVVQSLAKWKRLRLRDYGIPAGTGILTDMRALRPDEDFSPLHSISVDQWDWELVITPGERKANFLKEKVSAIYAAVKATEARVSAEFKIPPQLPREISFIHAKELQQRYPHFTPKQREDAIAKEHGAVFIMGIGGDLGNGEIHDGRAPDYDDWSTPTSPYTKGLNGDILFWNPVLERAFEISSMGIRVDPIALERQLAMCGQREQSQLYYHRELLEGKLPLSIGGGIGQSRLCMFLLQKQHIGEVQVSIWPEEMKIKCAATGIRLL